MARIVRLMAFMATVLLMVASALAAPSFINFQGVLNKADGTPVDNGTYNVTFHIYDVVSAGIPVWGPELHIIMITNAGRFQVKLGSNVPNINAAFDGGNRWLGMTVNSDPEMTPRSQISSVPYAMMAGTVEDKAIGQDKLADKAVGQGQINDKAVGQGQLGDKAVGKGQLEDKVVGKGQLEDKVVGKGQLEDKVVGKDQLEDKVVGKGQLEDKAVGQEQLDLDAVTTLHILNGTILFEDIAPNGSPLPSAGQVMKWSDMPIPGQWVLGDDETGVDLDWSLSGSVLYTNGQWGIARPSNTLYGLNSNTHINLGLFGITGALGFDVANATISGGNGNTAASEGATVGGGSGNLALGNYSTIPGGNLNSAGEGGPAATFEGATVGGGVSNTAMGKYSTVTGGWQNIAGKGSPTGTSEGATVGGGVSNTAMGKYSTVTGGWENTAGEGSQTGTGEGATVGGGFGNMALGNYSTISGGWQNSARGDFSFAAGSNARTDPPAIGSFVWNDHTGPMFVSTMPNQFLIRAEGGVGINTNMTNDAALTVEAAGPGPAGDLALDIRGEIKIADGTQGAGKVLTSDGSGLGKWQALPSGVTPGGTNGSVQFNNGGTFGGDAATFFWDNTNKRLGVGTAIPTAKIHIGGTPGTDGIRFPDGSLQTTAASGGGIGTVTSISAGTPGVVDGTSGLTYSVNPITTTGSISIANAGVTNAMLSNSSLTVTAGIGLAGGGSVPLGGSTTLNLANTAVTLGSFTRANITVDAQGRLTAASNSAAVNLITDITGTLPIANGGTGGTTAAGARTNLGAAANGANSDITSLTGLTTPLSTGQGGTGATTAAGARTNLGAASSGANSDITSLTGLTTPLSTSRGGTGATTAAGARTNLGAAASGANSDITSLTGLTTPLSTSQGGTGATTAAGARTNLGAAASGANSDITSLTGLTTPLSTGQGGTGTAVSFTPGSMVFAGTSGVYSQSNADIFWDNTNKRLGLGTTTPANKLDVEGGAVVGATYSGTNAAPANGLLVEGNVGIGTTTTGSRLTIGGGGGASLEFAGGSGTYDIRATHGGALYIFNTANNFLQLGTNNIARMTISSSGSVGIGTLSPTQALHVVGNICYTGSIAACSDARYKTDVKGLSSSLDKVLKLRGVTYSWRRSEFPDQKFDERTHIGFIAQEVEQYLPEVVTTDNNGFKSVDYSRLTPVLVETIKEQQLKIESLMERLSKVEAMLSAMSESAGSKGSDKLAAAKEGR